ncbi:4-carboxy-4-hydroxy-2-oxoadipate aldolase/oxaloacetate decarboxylase [Streptomyces sp. NPDC005492]|uniref:4-carboxy-4-hydroxy-2-oxoadipate aldolase/oxaloacetate decarboxylase n=1 Tax=Streptomyces sp. NPDC005492 TaxID=3156883 RepID=UPI0033A569C1
MPLRPRIITSIDRADGAVAKALGEHGVATVHEANARTGAMHGIHPVTPGLTASGTAVTCLNHAGDNTMVHAALAECRPGDVLVVGVTAPSEHGMFGDLLATSARALGLAGVVLAAAVRDVRSLREMEFPVWARAVAVSGTVKVSPGWVNVPISCGGVVVNPGDVVVADDDGVVAVERADAAGVLANAQARTENEEAVRPRFAAGELSVELGGLRPMLAGLERDTR